MSYEHKVLLFCTVIIYKGKNYKLLGIVFRLGNMYILVSIRQILVVLTDVGIFSKVITYI